MSKRLPKFFRPFFKFSLVSFSAIIILFSVLNVLSIVSTQKKQANLQTMALQQASRSLEDFIASTEQLGFIVQGSAQLLPYNLNKNHELPHNIVSQLEMLSPSVNSISSLGLVYTHSVYPEVNGVIYASTGVYDVDGYAAVECGGAVSGKSLRQVLEGLSTPGFVPGAGGERGCLLYAMPIPTQYVFSPGKLLFLLNYQSFTKGLRETSANSDVYVFNNKNELVLYLGNTYGNDLAAARLAMQQSEPLQGKAVFYYTMEKYGYTVTQAVDYYQFYSPTILALLGLAAITLAVFGFGAYLSYVFAQNTAKPINRLVQQASELGYGGPEGEQDEIAHLSAAFEQLVQQQDQLAAVMENSAQLEEAQYVLSLLGIGDALDFSQAVAEKYHAVFANKAGGGLCALTLRFDNTRSFLEKYAPKEQWHIKAQLRERFAALCEPLGFGVAVDMPGGQGIAAFVAFETPMDAESEVARLRDTLYESCGISLSCGMSLVVHTADELPVAFQKAVANCRYRLFGANSTFTPEYVSRMKAQRRKLNYTGSDELLQAVKACSHPGITHSVDRFFRDILQETSLPTYKLVYFEMLTGLSKLIGECDEKNQEMLVYLLNMLYENCYENEENLKRDFCEFCTLLADTLYDRRAAQLQCDLLDVILRYIETHYSSPLLSLSSIGEDLSFSPSYLTRYFKERTGNSLMQHIDKKRFEECKRLLKTTNLPIKEIVGRVGYTDEANFSRKFKRYEGITPKQYRFSKSQGSAELVSV